MARTILRVACFTTTDAQWRNVLEHYWTRGNEMPAPHGIELAHRNGSGPPIPQEINYAGDVIRKAGDTGDVRHQCHLASPNGRGIPVICCNFLAGALDTGNTVTPDDPDAADANRGVHWLPYILINARD